MNTQLHAYGKNIPIMATASFNFCAMNNLKIGSFLFQHKDIHKITWISNYHRTTTQFDHLAIWPIWRTPCLQVVKVHCEADICSDLKLVIAKVKIKPKRCKKSRHVLRHFDVSKRQKYPTMQLRFQMVLQNRFAPLPDITAGPI